MQQFSLHGMPVSCAKEPCVTGDDEFATVLLRWQAAVLRIVGHRPDASGVRHVFVDWQVPRGKDASRP